MRRVIKNNNTSINFPNNSGHIRNKHQSLIVLSFDETLDVPVGSGFLLERPELNKQVWSDPRTLSPPLRHLYVQGYLDSVERERARDVRAAMAARPEGTTTPHAGRTFVWASPPKGRSLNRLRSSRDPWT